MVSQYPGHIILALFLQCPLFGQKDPPTPSSQQELKLNHWLWRHEADVYREHLLRVNVLRVLLLTSVFVWHVVQASVLAKSYVVGTPNNSWMWVCGRVILWKWNIFLELACLFYLIRKILISIWGLCPSGALLSLAGCFMKVLLNVRGNFLCIILCLCVKCGLSVVQACSGKLSGGCNFEISGREDTRMVCLVLKANLCIGKKARMACWWHFRWLDEVKGLC